MDDKDLDNLLKEFDGSVDSDSGLDIDFSDIEDISLEELDKMAGIDLDGLELDDIDFDDVDITNLDTGINYKTSGVEPKDEEYDFDKLLSDEEKTEIIPPYEESSDEVTEVLPETDIEAKLDAMEDIGLDEVFGEADNQFVNDTKEPSNQELDDIFSSLGVDMSNDDVEDYTKSQDGFDDLFQSSMELSLENGDLDDIEDLTELKSAKSGKKKKKKEKGQKREKGASKDGENIDLSGKKTIKEILFGEPDEDDREEEILFEQKKAQKEIDKAKKAEEKAEKKAADAEKKALKLKESDKKKKEKSDKKAQKEQELREELEAEKDAKKVPTFVVILVFLLFAVLGCFVVMGTKSFDYSKVIKKATEYFDRKRYRLAYDEIAGVEVKEEDEDLRDRIYTVMYVERLYESYENNVSLERYDKALDSLIRGLQKYDEHYAEAVELKIVDDIDLCKEKIVTALWDTYYLSEADAYYIMSLEGQEYTKALEKRCEQIKTGE